MHIFLVLYLLPILTLHRYKLILLCRLQSYSSNNQCNMILLFLDNVEEKNNNSIRLLTMSLSNRSFNSNRDNNIITDVSNNAQKLNLVLLLISYFFTVLLTEQGSIEKADSTSK